MSKNSKVVVGVLYVVVAVAFFFGGVMFQQHKVNASAPMGNGGNRAGGTTVMRTGAMRGAAGGFGGGTSGTIVSVDNGMFTLQSQNGSTSIVSFSTSTPVTEQQVVDSSSLKTGAKVIVQGTSSNGTVSAKSISIVQNLPTMGGNTPVGSSSGTKSSAGNQSSAPMVPAPQQ